MMFWIRSIVPSTYDSVGGGYDVALQSTLRLTDFHNCTNMYRRPGRRDTNDVSEPTAGRLASLPALTLRGVRRGPAPACTVPVACASPR